MFIVAKRKFKIRRANGEYFHISKNFVGEIPEDIAGHWLVQAAIADGSIATPRAGRDRDLEAADSQAAERAKEADIRPDAKQDNPADEESGDEESNEVEPLQEGVKVGRAKSRK